MFQDLDCQVWGSGLPLVLVHGIQGTAASWVPVLPHLRGWWCVMPNLPGRAGSIRAASSPEAMARLYHVDVYADALHAVVCQAALEAGQPVLLAGWSMGVSVILRMWARHGGRRVARQVLLSGTAHVGEGAAWFSGTEVQAVAAQADARAQQLGLSEAADPLAVAYSWRSLQGLNQAPAARLIDVPTLIVHGHHDVQTPPGHAERLRSLIRGARLHWLDAGHSLMAEKPQELGPLMAFFLRETTSIELVSN